MGNSINAVITKLRDPYLVRRVQETFGLRVIEGDVDNATASPPVKEDGGMKHRSGKNVKKSSSNGRIISLAVKAIKKKRAKRKPAVSYIIDSPPSSPEGGSPPPEPADIDVETYPILDNYFKFVSLVGYEPFFITFLPYTYWNVDVLVARRLAFLWVVAVYISGAAKNLCKFVRPSSPPAIRLEVNIRLEQEYGFPSSHATIATVFSLYMAYICHSRYDFFYPMLLLSILTMLSVAISRVYLGVHTVLDVVGGVIIAGVVVLFLTPFLDTLDSLLFGYWYSHYVAIASAIVAMCFYPVSKQWSIDRGDTCAIVGASLGLLISCNVNGPCSDDLATGPFPPMLPPSQEIGFHLLRFIIGVLLVFPARFIMKLLCFRLLPAIMPDQGVPEVQKRPLVELPYKLITYTSISFAVGYICPVVFELCQIARDTQTGESFASKQY